MEKKLAIAGKKIVFKDLENKSLAQFKAQLKQNGVTIDDAAAERLFATLRGEETAEVKAAKAAAESKAAEMKAKAESAAKASIKPLAKGK